MCNIGHGHIIPIAGAVKPWKHMSRGRIRIRRTVSCPLRNPVWIKVPVVWPHDGSAMTKRTLFHVKLCITRGLVVVLSSGSIHWLGALYMWFLSTSTGTGEQAALLGSRARLSFLARSQRVFLVVTI